MKYPGRMIVMTTLCIACAARAAGGGGEGSARTMTADPVIASVQAFIARKDWSSAQATLLTALASNANDADYHNLYAYAVRKSAQPDMQVVFAHYAQALRIDPRHRGAHEYAGEAYLMVNDLPRAKEHLAALDKLCILSCEEYRDLKQAIAGYELSHPH